MYEEIDIVLGCRFFFYFMFYFSCMGLFFVFLRIMCLFYFRIFVGVGFVVIEDFFV